MVTTREVVLGGLAVALGVLAVASYFTSPEPSCKAAKAEATISARAAEICTDTLVGCSLTYEQVRLLVAEGEAAKACE